MTTRAVVVFLGKELVDRAEWYAWFLKPGFIHCFVLVESSSGWIKVDGNRRGVELTSLGPFNDILKHYQDQGATVVDTSTQREISYLPFAVRTCVGMIKTILGLRSFAQTPWQLYRYLTNQRSNQP